MGRHRNVGGSGLRTHPLPPAPELDEMKLAYLLVSAAQIADLHNTPVQILPPPGLGLRYLPIITAARMVGGSTPYTVTTQLIWTWGPDATKQTANAIDTANFGQTLNEWSFAPVYVPIQIATPGAFGDNAPLKLMALGPAFSGGNQNMNVALAYTTIQLN